ncbi:helix-turn-helix domain-containing protein [Streptomyces sp. YKOK-I1]
MDRPSFRAANSLSARLRLGMSPQDVAREMKVFDAPVDAELVIAWESGAHVPTESQLFALANVLWCRTSELMGIGEPRTLAEHRLVRQFSVPRLTRTIHMDAAVYRKAEAANRWPGNFRQTLALLHALNISLRQLEAATGPCDMMYSNGFFPTDR